MYQKTLSRKQGNRVCSWEGAKKKGVARKKEVICKCPSLLESNWIVMISILIHDHPLHCFILSMIIMFFMSYVVVLRCSMFMFSMLPERNDLDAAVHIWVSQLTTIWPTKFYWNFKKGHIITSEPKNGIM